MEVKNIDFSTKPKGYKLCFSNKCMLAEKCLRRIATEQIDDSLDSLQVVNHFKYEDKDCKYFVNNERVEIAYGMKGAFENILVSDVNKIRNELMEYFGQTGFYRRKNSIRPIIPKEQEVIANIFAKYGYSVSFDKIVETTFWKE